MTAAAWPRVLVVASRPPWPPVTGDRLRTLVWLEALAPVARVTLVAPARDLPAGAPACALVAPRRSPLHLAAGAARVLARGLPATALLAAGRDWPGALRRAAQDGPFDAAVVVLARLYPWVAGRLPARRVVLDGIDALAANLTERAAAARGPARALWRLEAARTARLELEAAAACDEVVVVSPGEAAGFGGRATAIGHGVEQLPLAEGPRDIDFGFWGRLGYFANRDAVAWLLDVIWPAIRAARPAATLLLAGADAPGWVRRRDGRDGVTVVSPMADRPALLRRVRVAVLPVRYGTGMPNKALEAAEAGCAIVATPAGVRGTGGVAAQAAVADAAEVLAGLAVALAADPARAAAQGRALRAAVEREHDRAAARRLLAALALGC